MPRFMLHHRHTSTECGIAYAAWRGFDSPLRHTETIAACPRGGHALWWTVEAADERAALALLPPFLAARTEATEIDQVPIP